ncbi:hypothetical protein C0Z16_37020 [Paraburkholderia rhynchosiae]|uniref:Uncharacterized protein n=1 Tax=Paraburkholderia rhynchosiae TaxID=487049 RepID=A0ABX4USS9_9BURK|nr:hypothetical protein C0Z16_37020 [Paraburkholderia rhynchosiae]
MACEFFCGLRVGAIVDGEPFDVDVAPPVPPVLGALIPAPPWPAPFAPPAPAPPAPALVPPPPAPPPAPCANAAPTDASANAEHNTALFIAFMMPPWVTPTPSRIVHAGRR